MLPVFLLILGLPALVGFLSDQPINISFFSQIYTLGVVERKALEAAGDDFSQWLAEPGALEPVYSVQTALPVDPLPVINQHPGFSDIYLLFCVIWFTMSLFLLYSLRRSNDNSKVGNGGQRTIYNTFNYVLMNPTARTSGRQAPPRTSAESGPRTPRRPQAPQAQTSRPSVAEPVTQHAQTRTAAHHRRTRLDETNGAEMTTHPAPRYIEYLTVDEARVESMEYRQRLIEGTVRLTEAEQADHVATADTCGTEPTSEPGMSPILDPAALAERSRLLRKRIRHIIRKKPVVPHLEEEVEDEAEGSNVSGERSVPANGDTQYVHPKSPKASHVFDEALEDLEESTIPSMTGPAESVESRFIEASRVVGLPASEDSSLLEDFHSAEQLGSKETPSLDISRFVEPDLDASRCLEVSHFLDHAEFNEGGSFEVSRTDSSSALDPTSHEPHDNDLLADFEASSILSPANMRSLLRFDAEPTCGLFPKMNFLGSLRANGSVASIQDTMLPDIPAACSSESVLDSAVVEHGPIMRLVDMAAIPLSVPHAPYTINTALPPDVIVSPATPQMLSEEVACPDWPPCPPSPSQLPNPYGSNSSSEGDDEDDEDDFQSNSYKTAPRFPPVFERPVRPASPQNWRARQQRPRVALAAWNYVSSWIRGGDEQDEE